MTPLQDRDWQPSVAKLAYARLEQLKTCVDYGEVMPNVPQMSRFFSAMGAALQIATEGRASAQASLREAEVNIRRR